MSSHWIIPSFIKLKIPASAKFILIIIVILILFFSIQSFRGSIKAVNRFDQRYLTGDSLTIKASTNDALYAMLNDKAFLQASLELADGDSIGLSINMQDSTVNLVLKGIVLYSCRMDGFRISPIFSKLGRQGILELSSRPLTILTDTANILKVPIRTIKAPKNEEEAALQVNLAAPDTTQEYVALRLETEPNFILAFEQVPAAVPKNAGTYHRFLAYHQNKALWSLWQNLLTFKTPDYRPTIRIYLPPDEVKSIYRALPIHGRVILKF